MVTWDGNIKNYGNYQHVNKPAIINYNSVIEYGSYSFGW
jgi:hypothetical protein